MDEKVKQCLKLMDFPFQAVDNCWKEGQIISVFGRLTKEDPWDQFLWKKQD